MRNNQLCLCGHDLEAHRNRVDKSLISICYDCPCKKFQAQSIPSIPSVQNQARQTKRQNQREYSGDAVKGFKPAPHGDKTADPIPKAEKNHSQDARQNSRGIVQLGAIPNPDSNSQDSPKDVTLLREAKRNRQSHPDALRGETLSKKERQAEERKKNLEIWEKELESYKRKHPILFHKVNYDNEVIELTYSELKEFIHFEKQEAVQKLKEEFLNEWENSNGKTFTLNEIREKIDAIFGRRLTE